MYTIFLIVLASSLVLTFFARNLPFLSGFKRDPLSLKLSMVMTPARREAFGAVDKDACKIRGFNMEEERK